MNLYAQIYDNEEGIAVYNISTVTVFIDAGEVLKIIDELLSGSIHSSFAVSINSASGGVETSAARILSFLSTFDYLNLVIYLVL